MTGTHYTIYTDGSAAFKLKGRPAGWAFVVVHGDVVHKESGSMRGTSVDAEVEAMRRALKWVPMDATATIISDCQGAIRRFGQHTGIKVYWLKHWGTGFTYHRLADRLARLAMRNRKATKHARTTELSTEPAEPATPTGQA